MSRRLILLLWVSLVPAAVSFAQTSYDTSETGQTGEKILGSYFKTDIDSVSLKNGQLHLSIPVFSLPGRELPAHFILEYNSRFTERRTVYNEEEGIYVPFWDFYVWKGNAGQAGSLSGTLTDIGIVPSESIESWQTLEAWIAGLQGSWCFRGQRDANWRLTTSLDRAVRIEHHTENSSGWYHLD
jgi:hypothetical protein